MGHRFSKWCWDNWTSLEGKQKKEGKGPPALDRQQSVPRGSHTKRERQHLRIKQRSLISCPQPGKPFLIHKSHELQGKWYVQACETKNLCSSQTIHWGRLFAMLIRKAMDIESITHTNQKENWENTWAGTPQKMKPKGPTNVRRAAFHTHRTSKHINGWRRVGKRAEQGERLYATVGA